MFTATVKIIINPWGRIAIGEMGEVVRSNWPGNIWPAYKVKTAAWTRLKGGMIVKKHWRSERLQRVVLILLFLALLLSLSCLPLPTHTYKTKKTQNPHVFSLSRGRKRWLNCMAWLPLYLSAWNLLLSPSNSKTACVKERQGFACQGFFLPIRVFQKEIQ